MVHSCRFIFQFSGAPECDAIKRFFSSVSDILKELNWPTLQERCFIVKTCLFHKAVNDNIAVKFPSFIMTPKQLQGRSQQQFVKIGANTNTYLYSFFPRTIRCWNILPIEYRKLKEVITACFKEKIAYFTSEKQFGPESARYS